MPAVIDTTDSDLIADVVATLEAIEADDGEPLFTEVRLLPDAGSYLDFVDSAQAAGICGVVAYRSERQIAHDNDLAFVARLPLEVIVGVWIDPPLGGDMTTAANQLDERVDQVRSALSVDKFRSGLAKSVMWGGSMLDATDLTARPTPLHRAKVKGVPSTLFSSRIPVACGYTIASD